MLSFYHAFFYEKWHNVNEQKWIVFSFRDVAFADILIHIYQFFGERLC